MGGAKNPFFLLSVPKNHKKVNAICNVHVATRALEVVVWVWEWNLKVGGGQCNVYNGKTTVWLGYFNVCVNYSTSMDIHGQQLFPLKGGTWYIFSTHLYSVHTWMYCTTTCTRTVPGTYCIGWSWSSSQILTLLVRRSRLSSVEKLYCPGLPGSWLIYLLFLFYSLPFTVPYCLRGENATQHRASLNDGSLWTPDSPR